MKKLYLRFHCWKWVWCLWATSLIMHLTWMWIWLWPWAVTVLCWPFSLRERTSIPTYRHLKTSLSCPGSLFHKKNDCIVAFTSYGNNFCSDLTVKSNGFALFLCWKCCQHAKLSCVLVCVCVISKLRCQLAVIAFRFLPGPVLTPVEWSAVLGKCTSPKAT